LNCAIKRTKGFAPSEIIQFKNVPLGELGTTNYFGWKTNVNGTSVTLDYIIHRAPDTNSSCSSDEVSCARFVIHPMTNDIHCDLLTARTDTGTNLECGSWSSSSNWRKYFFPTLPLDATEIDLSVAVQQSRWVEFTVKPEVGPARLERKRTSGK
jgi:hypothetical protein